MPARRRTEGRTRTARAALASVGGLALLLGCGAIESAVCDDEATPTCEPARHDDDTGPTKPSEPEPEPEPQRPDDAACATFVDHMAVVTAQSLGVPSKNLFTPGERTEAIEHCKRYAHPNVLACGKHTQVLPYLQTCLFSTGLPRPEVAPPSRQTCERYAERTREIVTALQGRTVGYTPPSSHRSQEQSIEHCTKWLTPQEAECGIEAGSQLGVLSCFSPYQVGDRTWPTAEECEAYGDHMVGLIGGFLLAPYPKPLDALQALQNSGLAPYATPQVQRFQLVNLCHQLDREMMQCHTQANSVVDLGRCVP